MQPAEGSHQLTLRGATSQLSREWLDRCVNRCHIPDRHGGAKACAAEAVELWQGCVEETFTPSVADVKLLSLPDATLLKQVCGRWKL